MDGNFVGLAAVVMIFGIPMAAMYTFFRVRKLRSEERLAAMARGLEVPMQAELSEAARSRRSGILLVAGWVRPPPDLAQLRWAAAAGSAVASAVGGCRGRRLRYLSR